MIRIALLLAVSLSLILVLAVHSQAVATAPIPPMVLSATALREIALERICREFIKPERRLNCMFPINEKF